MHDTLQTLAFKTFL